MFYNAVDFSDLFTRESLFFNPNLQRVKNIIAPVTGCLSFEYIPGIMPESTPVATLTSHLSNGTTTTINQSHTVELIDRFVFLFQISDIGLIAGDCDFKVTVEGSNDVAYSEKCEAYELADFPANNLVRIIACNNDMRYGYISSTYLACGFFRVSNLNSPILASDSKEYKYSFGRSMVLSSENYLKSTFTFIQLSRYQQNLLKFLCKCNVMSINGVTYQLIGDLKEENKDPLKEVCDLSGEFVLADQSYSTFAASIPASSLTETNIFL